MSHLASYVLLLVFLVLNVRLPGLPIAAAGFACNLLVIAANGGRMPVDADDWSQTAGAYATRMPGRGVSVFRIEDSRILLHARKDFVLREHRIADVFLSDSVPFVVVEAKVPEEHWIDQFRKLSLEHALARALRRRVGAGNAEEDGRRRLAALASRLESRESSIKGLVEW